MRVADDRIGHLLAAQQEQGDDLKLTFLLAMDPDHTYEGLVRNVAMTTDTLDQGGPQVLVTASVDRQALRRLRPAPAWSLISIAGACGARLRLAARRVGRRVHARAFLVNEAI